MDKTTCNGQTIHIHVHVQIHGDRKEVYTFCIIDMEEKPTSIKLLLCTCI